MYDATFHSLMTLLDNRSIYAAARAGGFLVEDAPGLDREAEARLAKTLQDALTRFFELRPLTDEQLEAARSALAWYDEFEHDHEVSLDAARAFLDIWNRPEELVDHREAHEVGYAILFKALNEETKREERERRARLPFDVTEPPKQSCQAVTTVPKAVRVRSWEATRTMRWAHRLLENGQVYDAVDRLDDAIEELEWIREQVQVP